MNMTRSLSIRIFWFSLEIFLKKMMGKREKIRKKIRKKNAYIAS